MSCRSRTSSVRSAAAIKVARVHLAQGRWRLEAPVERLAQTSPSEPPSHLVGGHREQRAAHPVRVDLLARAPGCLPAGLHRVLGGRSVTGHAVGEAHERGLVQLDELLELVGRHRSLLRRGKVQGVDRRSHHHINYESRAAGTVPPEARIAPEREGVDPPSGGFGVMGSATQTHLSCDWMESRPIHTGGHPARGIAWGSRRAVRTMALIGRATTEPHELPVSPGAERQRVLVTPVSQEAERGQSELGIRPGRSRRRQCRRRSSPSGVPAVEERWGRPGRHPRTRRSRASDRVRWRARPLRSKLAPWQGQRRSCQSGR